MGDFNTNPGDLNVLAGTPAPADETVTSDPPTFDTGFDPDTKELSWSHLTLVDTFADMHQWGKNVGPGKMATSCNADRCEWIDMMFHSKDTLQPVERSDQRAPSTPLPNREHGSDHTPIWARFNFNSSL